MPLQKVRGYGMEFATKHGELIAKILIEYANSLNVINVMTETDDRRVPLGPGAGEQDEDDERLCALD